MPYHTRRVAGPRPAWQKGQKVSAAASGNAPDRAVHATHNLPDQSTRCTTARQSPRARKRDTLCANACGKAEDATGAAISSRDADGAACMLFGAMRGYDAHAHPCATTMKQCWAAPSQGHGRPTQRRSVRHTTRHEMTLRTCDGNTGSHRGSVGTGHLADQSATLLPQTLRPQAALQYFGTAHARGTATQ